MDGGCRRQRHEGRSGEHRRDGVISPLLANCYFRRFLLAWKEHGHQQQLDAHVVNYADDFVICCRVGNAEAAMVRMQG